MNEAEQRDYELAFYRANEACSAREAEIVRLRAVIAEVRARVEALADSWDDPDPERGDPDKADALRAALADPEARP